jgi:hypothetical protein
MISQVLLITIILVRLITLLLGRFQLTDLKRWHVGSCNQVRSWCGGKPPLSLSLSLSLCLSFSLLVILRPALT